MGCRTFSRPVLARIVLVLSCLALAAGPAVGRTYEGFTFGAKAGVSLNNPYAWGTDHPGNFLFAVSPGLKLFENRLVLEGDIGLSERLVRHESIPWWRERWDTDKDTLFRDRWISEEERDEYRFFYAYKGVLNLGAWSAFAGHMVYVRFIDSEEHVSHTRAYSTSAPDSMQYLSQEEFDVRSLWGFGSVVPVYGIARRFGRWSLHLQGASLVSLQALVGVSLNPVRRIGPHR